MPTRLGMGQFGKARPQWKEIASGYAVIRPESVASVTEVCSFPEADFPRCPFPAGPEGLWNPRTTLPDPSHPKSGGGARIAPDRRGAKTTRFRNCQRRVRGGEIACLQHAISRAKRIGPTYPHTASAVVEEEHVLFSTVLTLCSLAQSQCQSGLGGIVI
jgi:hypothetical protein